MRFELTAYQLKTLVYNELYQRLLSRDIFTAYSITTALRKRNENVEISHDSVRQLVHKFMSEERTVTLNAVCDDGESEIPVASSRLVVNQNYTSEIRYYNGDPAQTYFPAPVKVEVGSTAWGTYIYNGTLEDLLNG